MSEPGGCSLSPEDLPERLQAWRGVVATAKAVVREDPQRLRLALLAGTAVETAELCVAELSCCPFFRFTLDLASTGASLTIAVPAERAGLLDELYR